MSSCDTCSCPDKTNCPKKGKSYGIDIIENKKHYYDDAAEVSTVEHDGKCKCGAGYTCVTYTCGH